MSYSDKPINSPLQSHALVSKLVSSKIAYAAKSLKKLEKSRYSRRIPGFVVEEHHRPCVPVVSGNFSYAQSRRSGQPSLCKGRQNLWFLAYAALCNTMRRESAEYCIF